MWIVHIFVRVLCRLPLDKSLDDPHLNLLARIALDDIESVEEKVSNLLLITEWQIAGVEERFL